jgi:uncharacterized protein YkwD
MTITRRLGTLILAILAVTTVSPAVAADTATGLSIAQAEHKAVVLINQMRVHDGSVPMQVSPGLMAIAEMRSKHNAAIHDMQHDLDAVVAGLAAHHIWWAYVGEALAYTYPMPLADSAAQAVDQWHDSHDHHVLLVDHRVNYLGVGLAIDASTGRRHWTALVIEGKDVTPPVASMKGSAKSSVTSTRVDTTVSWSASDVRLSIHTAGVATLDVARSTDGGPWVTLLRRTSLRTRSWDLRTGHSFRFRVRARDKAGNLGAWSAPLAVQT